MEQSYGKALFNAQKKVSFDYTTPYIQSNPSGTHTFHIPRVFIEGMIPTLLTMITVTMESWAVWRNDIVGSNSTLGWEYEESIAPEIIAKAFKQVSGYDCKII